ncbi:MULTISPECIES: NAD(P)H-dependent glycerol-3-phosphate dehydrogenase [unclassified Okeania]|uniref:NAD(P)H-dependent glycerol-3-phosphate dehydrogenase n=1 Tax=unclassified Okeania TaxID=2634635 RepID=UPI0013B8A493|nr:MULTISPECIES: NAD(P)H-dependent glycerol-3-phosphate dehydrogenase [unclassified Okeania]NES74784.1 NAD(P)H-dependent glycerol-3-phosphate dehydrogenase [Okeania sp. SIO1H4]NET18931.1 NAD(P)H-dependent glycerol-3-phosphate dehydrogenase [Okeania sp. SIO1H5]NET94429.1 NAD(P)H-dependent glycerol-3-phosphate dehydrogenase [Okeania sp. SIO1H2]
MVNKISQADKRREIIKTLDSAYPVSSEKATLAIIGAGAWGYALAKLAGHNQHEIHLWSRSLNVNLSEILQDVDIIVSAISMKGVNETAEKIKKIGLSEKVIIVTATKGLDPATRRTPSQIWETNFPNNSVVVLSGPNLSKEINDKLPAATVVASKNKAAATTVQNIFASGLFRVYSSPDPIGTELGGTLKNVIAIAAGVCDGLELGTNAKSALLTRALTEMIRVGNHLGGQTETFFGLSGLGDMLATCSSSLSRNYRVGYGLAQGKSLEKILDELQGTAEGVNTTNVLIDLAYREEIRVPISHQVFLLLNGKITPEEAVVALMERDLKAEFCD